MNRKYLFSVYLGLMIILLFPTVGLASYYESGAMTPPPPPDPYISLFTAFDPSFNYLDDGVGNIAKLEDGKVTASGYSMATQYVDTIGIKLIVQKWTGSIWEDYNIGTELTRSDELDIYTTKQINVSTGYYYRVRSIHWAIENGVREQGERFSSSVLVN